MGFEKGDSRINRIGRKVGSLNRSTEQIKLTLARAANRTLDTLGDDIEKLKETNPEKAIELSLKILEYVTPKLKSIDMKASVELDARIHSINVTINRTGRDEPNN